MTTAYWINTLWMWTCRPEAAAFRRATRAVEETQMAVLRAMIRENALTLFGREHDFPAIRNVRDYRQRVPLSIYDDYSGWVRQIAQGTPNVLTRQPVRLLEPTSGTTSGEKLIPYTPGLRKQFQRGLAAWIADLMRHHRGARQGRAYWSISPNLGLPRQTPSGIPIGFDDDTEYLGWWERRLASRVLAVPPDVVRQPDLAAFRYLTLLHLLRTADLSLISVWSPSFLTALLAPLAEWRKLLCSDIRRGTATVPAAAGTGERVLPQARFRPDPQRATRVNDALAAEAHMADKLRAVWPQLTLISCWADGPAKWALHDLQTLFPEVEIQAKGLIATEAFVSFPLCGRNGAALALRSHFFEFEEAPPTGQGRDDGHPGELRLAHQLEQGARYRVVVTTGGGLYRYQLRDEVAVVGFENECPLLRFCGKTDCISDLAGEKLSEAHVASVLDRVFASAGLPREWAMLVPVAGSPPHYRLYLDGTPPDDGPGRKILADTLEAGLSENPYYRHAVSLGQLAPAEVQVLNDPEKPGRSRYEQRCLELGQKLGDIKPTALDPRAGWADVLSEP